MKRLDKYRIQVEKRGDMRIDALIYADAETLLEESAVNQLRDAACLPGVAKALATPDIHHGFGVPIGSVVAMKDAVIPAAVGYDINCGMRILSTPLKRGDIEPEALARSIARDIPLGEGKSNVRLSRDDLEKVLERGVKALAEVDLGGGRAAEAFRPDEASEDAQSTEDFGALPGEPGALSDRAVQRGTSQLGTLGGGNHFIEIQYVERVERRDAAEFFGLEEGRIVLMIHSGSRGLGHQVAGDYAKVAAEMTAKQCPNRELAFLPADGREGRRYVGAMRAAANFAYANRQIMAALVRHNFRRAYGDMPLPMVYDVTHNMAKRETHGGQELWIHRKGATRAFPPGLMRGTRYERIGQPVLIPGSMGTASYVLVGTEKAAESLYSVNHGAGRRMSRTAAAGKGRHGQRRQAAISDQRFKESMEGIALVCADRAGAKEEAPDAYKDIDAVVRVVAGAGLADVVARLRPLGVLKG